MTTVLYLFVATMMTVVHYPIGRVYVELTLHGLPKSTIAELRMALRPRLQRLFWIWLASCLAVAFATIASGFSETVTRMTMGVTIIGFHAIWWPFVVPIFRRMETELRERGIERIPSNAGTVRMASLSPRTVASYFPAWMRILPVVLVSGAVAAIFWRGATAELGNRISWPMVTIFASSGVFIVVAWSIWIRREITASYLADGPEDVAGERMASAEALRRFRVKGIYWLQVTSAMVFFGVSLLCLEVGRGTVSDFTLGVVGGVAGTFVGVAGGCFGMLASVRAHHAFRNIPKDVKHAGLS